ncbi:hypothetical protein ACH121_30760 [Streptomyces sp. NB004]
MELGRPAGRTIGGLSGPATVPLTSNVDINEHGRRRQRAATYGASARAETEQISAVIKRVVLELNEINEDHDGAGYETEEREELCLYIDQTLTEHGIDVPALAARRGISRTEITDGWRDW